MSTRRHFLRTIGGGLAAAAGGLLVPRSALAKAGDAGPPNLPSGALESSLLDALPGKKPLIKRTYRPPNYETPVEYFDQPFTPNDAFFVRYHLANIPEVKAAEWKLQVGGDAAQKPFTLGLDELKREFEPVEVAAVNQCSGNRRGLFEPHVAGVEWGYGAMGNARWKGARLKDVLGRAGLTKEAVEIAFDGADEPVFDKTPDFVKSLPVWKALDENTLVAWEMNGEPLPHWNGFPARIVVPGWTATYWMKHLVAIRALAQPFQGFWMKSAYRIPKGKFPVVDRFLTQETDVNTPITEMVVNSLITSPRGGQRVAAGRRLEVKGIAWDGGYGIRLVEVSTDGGRSWRAAELGKDLGRFSFRQWTYAFAPDKKGSVVMSRATNRAGATQTFELIANPAGYHHNVVQRVELHVA
ncbi:MAG TPA: molybdopterin-dependent oxidoreductase [Anaeromyxobacter sp.]|nr:molybdopterin-dependent oxidoreductase [Anaeromyxobacter sp.]